MAKMKVPKLNYKRMGYILLVTVVSVVAFIFLLGNTIFYPGYLYGQLDIGMTKEEVDALMWRSWAEKVEYEDTILYKKYHDKTNGAYYIYWVNGVDPIEVYFDENDILKGSIQTYE